MKMREIHEHFSRVIEKNLKTGEEQLSALAGLDLVLTLCADLSGIREAVENIAEALKRPTEEAEEPPFMAGPSLGDPLPRMRAWRRIRRIRTPGEPPASFATAYPAPWRIQGLEVVDRDGCNVQDFEADTPEEREFWQGVVDAVNAGIVTPPAAPTAPSITIHPTTKFVEVNGQKLRIWEGTGPAGEHVYCEVLGVHVHPEADQTPYQTMLQEAEAPSPVVRAIDARFVL